MHENNRSWLNVVLGVYATHHTVQYSRDHKGVGVAHEITSPKKPAISPDDNEAGKTKPKQAFRSIRNAFSKLLQNFKNIYIMNFFND